MTTIVFVDAHRVPVNASTVQCIEMSAEPPQGHANQVACFCVVKAEGEGLTATECRAGPCHPADQATRSGQRRCRTCVWIGRRGSLAAEGEFREYAVKVPSSLGLSHPADGERATHTPTRLEGRAERRAADRRFFVALTANTAGKIFFATQCPRPASRDSVRIWRGLCDLAQRETVPSPTASAFFWSGSRSKHGKLGGFPQTRACFGSRAR